MRALGDLFPILDPVVGDVESCKFLQGRHIVQSFDLIVRKPKLLKRGSDVFQILNSLDVVARQRENFEVL